MAFQDNDGGGFQRKMYQGNWVCSKCGKEITELPFEPDPNRANQLKCKDCFKENLPPRRNFGRY